MSNDRCATVEAGSRLSIDSDWLGNSLLVREKKSCENGIVRWRIYARYFRVDSDRPDPEVVIDAPDGGDSARPVVVMKDDGQAVAVWTQYLSKRHVYRTFVSHFHPIRGWGLARCADALRYEEIIAQEAP